MAPPSVKWSVPRDNILVWCCLDIMFKLPTRSSSDRPISDDINLNAMGVNWELRLGLYIPWLGITKTRTHVLVWLEHVFPKVYMTHCCDDISLEWRALSTCINDIAACDPCSHLIHIYMSLQVNKCRKWALPWLHSKGYALQYCHSWSDEMSFSYSIFTKPSKCISGCLFLHKWVACFDAGFESFPTSKTLSCIPSRHLNVLLKEHEVSHIVSRASCLLWTCANWL